MLKAGAAWEIAVTHPGGNPLALLTDALLDADLYDRREENARENLLATLSRSHFGLVEAVKQAGLGEDRTSYWSSISSKRSFASTRPVRNSRRLPTNS